MSITDELRKYADKVDAVYGKSSISAMIRDIADRIDAAHEHEVADARNDALYRANDKDMAELGWVRLPVDANGEVIHIGDKIDVYQTKNVEVAGVGDQVVFTHYYMGDYHRHFAGDCRHHHEPTVEDVLREFAGSLASAENNWGSDVDDAIAEYAEKLRLRED